jgi:hypothetical protein
MAATVISLDEYRARKNPRASMIGRLDLAVGRLDPLIRSRAGRLSASAERELEQIARAVSQGMTRKAAERAERLADLLEHPAANA